MRAWSSAAATTWDLGVIAGTGVVGAVLYGDPARHVIAFAHERFFVPANSRRPAPDLAAVLPEVRRELGRGDEVAAANLIRQRLEELGIDAEELIWTDPLGPIAQLEWIPDQGETAEYARELDTDDAGASVSWSRRGDRTGIRIVAERGASGFDIELWSDSEVSGSLALRGVEERRSGAETVATVDYSGDVELRRETTARRLCAVVQAAGLESGTSSGARVIIDAGRDMEMTDDGWRVRILPHSPVRLRVAIIVDAYGDIDALFKDAAPLIAAGRPARLALGPVASDYVQTEALWKSARAGDPAAVSTVFEMTFLAGQRNVAASTGMLPPTLQGVWQGTWSPAWSADYTLNGNVQLGTLASVLWTGAPELMTSLFRLVRQFPDDYRSNARAVFGAPGMLLPARLTTHGHANHFLRDYPHQFWTGHGSWLLRMAADYIQVTGDRSIVDDWLWEYAIEILAFGVAVIEDGGGHLVPSYSPENTPTGRENPLSVDATSDIAALRDGLRIGAWLAELVGDDVRAQSWSAARIALPPYRVAEDGTLAEWGAGWQETIAHRHVSQLLGLWYEPDEAFEDPALRAAAAETVTRKVAWRAESPDGPPGRMEMAFGLSSIALAAANLGDSASAYQCALWLARDHFTPALVSTHDAGAIFNLDASGALPAVVASMLLATTRREIRLLPALPREWASGRIEGLSGRGGVRVRSLAWSSRVLEVDLSLLPEAEWLRDPNGTRVGLPVPGVLRPGQVAEQTSPLSIRIPPGTQDISFTVDLADPETERSGELP